MGNSLAIQWLGLRASTAGGMGSIPGQETKIPQATWRGQKETHKKHDWVDSLRQESLEEDQFVVALGQRGRTGERMSCLVGTH